MLFNKKLRTEQPLTAFTKTNKGSDVMNSLPWLVLVSGLMYWLFFLGGVKKIEDKTGLNDKRTHEVSK